MSLRALSYPVLESKENQNKLKVLWFHKITKHPVLRPYFRLFFLIVFLNLLLGNFSTSIHADASLHYALINFLIASFFRQQWWINVLFKVATSLPHSVPLSIRWAAGKVYHFGGIAIGTYFSGSVWFFIYTYQVLQIPELSILHGMNLFQGALLLSIMITALPQIRGPYHNLFERTARFGGWINLVLFWVTYFIFSSYQNDGIDFSMILSNFDFYGLLYITFCTLLPWLTLKKVDVSIETPSNHVALTDFKYGETPFAGSSTDLSTNPLLEWHSFANIPYPDQEGFRLTISRAGDWTGRLIDQKPKKLWVKGITTAGVGNVETLFKKVIWVATGSGIGPCIPHLLSKKVPSVLVWSTRDPRKTYGDALVDEILEAQPHAIIWDTTKNGKPDLVKLAIEAYQKHDAEAVICISNQKTTYHVNYELESRGIPSFGAIWDS